MFTQYTTLQITHKTSLKNLWNRNLQLLPSGIDVFFMTTPPPPSPPLCRDHWIQMQELNTLFTFLFLAQKHTLFQALISLASWDSDNMPIQGSCSCTFLKDILLTRGCRAGCSRGVFAGDLRVLNEPSGIAVCTGILIGQFNSFGSFLNSWKKEKKVKSCCLGPSSEEPYSGMPQDRVKI